MSVLFPFMNPNFWFFLHKYTVVHIQSLIGVCFLDVIDMFNLRVCNAVKIMCSNHIFIKMWNVELKGLYFQVWYSEYFRNNQSQGTKKNLFKILCF